MADIFERLETLLQNIAPPNVVLTPAEALAELGTPALSLALLRNDEIHSHCITTAQDNTETMFQAASISKPVTGLATMKLIELGHLSLEDRLVDKLPQDIVDILMQDTRKRDMMKLITIKQLMSHTSGLSVHGFDGYINKVNIPTIKQIIQGTSSNTPPITLKTPPGWQHMYSGGGIILLQCVLEHIMQKPFPEIMQQHLFQPLQMTRSSYTPIDDNIAQAYHNGHFPCENKYHHKPELAAAGLWTTPTDLMKVVRAVQRSLKGTPDSFLKKETAELMLTKVMDDALTWQVTTYSFHHSGYTFPGWSCIFTGFADLPFNKGDWDKPGETIFPAGSGVAIMTNSAIGINVYDKILLALAYLQNWSQPFHQYPWSTTIKVPLPLARGEIDEEWKGWISDQWADKKRKWSIQDRDGPVGGFEGCLLELRPAAVPRRKYENGRESVDFVVDGLEMFLRLGWDGEERMIEVHYLSNGQRYTSAKMRKGGPRLCDSCKRRM